MMIMKDTYPDAIKYHICTTGRLLRENEGIVPQNFSILVKAILGGGTVWQLWWHLW